MRSRAHSLVLLLAFSAGGVVAPAVHRAHHASEAGAELVAHAAAGHHHHEVFGAHGVEWTPGCDTPARLHDLACVLCKGLGSCALPASAAHWAPDRPFVPHADVFVSGGVGHAGRTLARGPPHRIA